MFSRVIFLLLFSSTTWASSVSICVDIDMSIDPIVYVDPASGVSSYTSETVDGGCSETKIFSISEQDDLSISVMYGDNYLEEKRIYFGGTNTDRVFPETNFDYERVYSVNGTPYLIDVASDSIWQWDSALSYWKDLGDLISLPQGNLDESAFVYGDALYFSVLDGDDKGLWKLGLIPEKVSELNLTDAKLAFTQQGIGQFHQLSETYYEINWLIDSYPTFGFAFYSGQVSYFNANANSSGSLFTLFVGDQTSLFWLDSVGVSSSVELPLGWKYFGGCFNSQTNILCAFDVEGQGFSLYEVVDGGLKLDSIVGSDTFDLSLIVLKNIYAAGKNRFISFEVNGASYLYSANDIGQYLLDSGNTENMNYYLYHSRDFSRFYWLEYSADSVKINKVDIAGDSTYQRLYVEPSESIEEESDEDSSKSIDGESEMANSGEGSDGGGSMPIYLLAMLLILLAPRVRWYRVSGV